MLAIKAIGCFYIQRQRKCRIEKSDETRIFEDELRMTMVNDQF